MYNFNNNIKITLTQDKTRENINNHHSRCHLNRSKKKSTISAKAYKDMQNNWGKPKKKK